MYEFFVDKSFVGDLAFGRFLIPSSRLRMEEVQKFRRHVGHPPFSVSAVLGPPSRILLGAVKSSRCVTVVAFMKERLEKSKTA